MHYLHHLDIYIVYINWFAKWMCTLSALCRNVMFLPYGYVENSTIWTCALQSPYGYAHRHYSNMLSNWFYQRYSYMCISSTIWAVIVLSSQPLSYVTHVSLVQNDLLQGWISQKIGPSVWWLYSALHISTRVSMVFWDWYEMEAVRLYWFACISGWSACCPILSCSHLKLTCLAKCHMKVEPLLDCSC